MLSKDHRKKSKTFSLVNNVNQSISHIKIKKQYEKYFTDNSRK